MWFLFYKQGITYIHFQIASFHLNDFQKASFHFMLGEERRIDCWTIEKAATLLLFNEAECSLESHLFSMNPGDWIGWLGYAHKQTRWSWKVMHEGQNEVVKQPLRIG